MKLDDLHLDKIYSYKDYYDWQLEERIELIKGKIFVVSPPSTAHQEIAGDIFFALKKFLQIQQCKVYFAPFDVRLPRKSNDDKEIFTVLQPDVCVVCDTNKIDKRGCIGAPDIVVEVLSPGNNVKELKNKYEVYEEAGVKEYWVVSPQDQTFVVYTLHEGKFQMSPIKVPGDVITSSVLSGFTLDLTELFKNLDPDKL